MKNTWISALLFGCFTLSPTANACLDLSGNYVQKFWGTWTLKIAAEQKGCEAFMMVSTIPTGTTFSQTLILDGLEHIIGQDPSSGLVHYSTARIDEKGIWTTGRSTENGALKTYRYDSWTLNEKGSLVNSIDEYQADGKPLGPAKFVFERY